MIQYNQYVPVLKWREGEYQALLRLDDLIKSFIVPLIVIPPIEFDFEEWRPKKKIDEHLEKFGKRVKEKWGTRPALIDMHESLDGEVMVTGELPIQYIMRALDDFSCNYLPVLSPAKGDKYIDAVKNNLEKFNGIAIRLTLPDIAHPNINQWLSDLVTRLRIDKQHVDLVVDLVRPDTFIPYSGFGKLVSHYINSIFEVKLFRSLVLVGTSLNLREVKKPGGEFDRHEWIFYKTLVDDHLEDQLHLAFGDYSIETPEFQKTDFRIMNPAGKIIYTCDEVWLISKGGSFRDNRSQMVRHCRNIRDSAYYDGPDFSWGDAEINETANSSSSNYGNLGTWKKVGVNHHITKVIHQVASFYGS